MRRASWLVTPAPLFTIHGTLVGQQTPFHFSCSGKPERHAAPGVPGNFQFCGWLNCTRPGPGSLQQRTAQAGLCEYYLWSNRFDTSTHTHCMPHMHTHTRTLHLAGWRLAKVHNSPPRPQVCKAADVTPLSFLN